MIYTRYNSAPNHWRIIMKKQPKESPIKRRNVVALSPLMRKSHTHVVSRKAQRRTDKVKLNKGDGYYQVTGFAPASR
jgi:hypothetical protein